MQLQLKQSETALWIVFFSFGKEVEDLIERKWYYPFEDKSEWLDGLEMHDIVAQKMEKNTTKVEGKKN